MGDICLTFHYSDNLFCLESVDYSTLLADGMLDVSDPADIAPWAVAESWGWCNPQWRMETWLNSDWRRLALDGRSGGYRPALRSRQAVLPGRLDEWEPALAYYGDDAYKLVFDEPEAELQKFLGRARFARYSRRTKRLVLADHTPLFVWLLRNVALAERGRRIDKQAFISGQVTATREPLSPGVAAALASTGRFMGRVAVCSCGEAGCGSEYAWIENDICMLYLRIRHVGTKIVQLYPFVLR